MFRLNLFTINQQFRQFMLLIAAKSILLSAPYSRANSLKPAVNVVCSSSYAISSSETFKQAN